MLIFGDTMKKMKITAVIPLITLSLFFTCCSLTGGTEAFEKIECPAEISSRAFYFAGLYRDSDTEYGWGGQDPLRAITIDCSGLVVMCYKYAVDGTDYSLLFADASSSALYRTYSVKTETPRRGDLIFMGEKNSSSITHIAIFDRIENGNVFFIDSTLKDEDGDGVNEINGVTERSYGTGDERIKSYGIMLLKRK